MSEVRQDIYDHNGSRIWIDTPYKRNLLADTYLENADFARAVKGFIEGYLIEHPELLEAK